MQCNCPLPLRRLLRGQPGIHVLCWVGDDSSKLIVLRVTWTDVWGDAHSVVKQSLEMRRNCPVSDGDYSRLRVASPTTKWPLSPDAACMRLDVRHRTDLTVPRSESVICGS